MNTSTAPALEATPFQAAKTKQHAAWSAGDYAAIGTTLQIVGERLCEAADLRPGATVLDVAAGNGNATLAAARRFCTVTSTDYVPALLERARERADAERLDVCFQVADAEDLPFDTNSFDVVLSTFGVMFTPDQEAAAHQMLRVCRSGGTIALANWTPGGLIGQVFKTIGGYIPPAPGLRSPTLWGTEKALQDLFGLGAAGISVTPNHFTFRYKSVDHFVEFFKTYYGPMSKAFDAVGDRSDALERDLRDILEAHNTATDGSLVAPSEYAEVIIKKA